jgi:outer membrane protein assembly factor BamB
MVFFHITASRDNENDGPFKDEKLTGPFDADVIWSFDMMEEVGSYPHNMSTRRRSCREPDLVSTSNGRDESHVSIPPRAVVIALDRTPALVGKTRSKTASPRTVVTPLVDWIGGVMQVVSAQGDGWVRGYEAETGKKLWEFDTNPKDAVWPRTRNELIATPVIFDGKVYIGNGQDPEHGEGIGHFYAIDATKRGDITQSGRVWQFDKTRRSISTAAIADGLVYVADFSGYPPSRRQTGQEYWTHDVLAAVWASPFVLDGRVYLGDEDGDVVVLQAGKELKVLHEMNMGSAVYGTVVPANGTLFLNNRTQLFALAVK